MWSKSFLLVLALIALFIRASGQVCRVHNMTSLKPDTPLLFANVPNQLAILSPGIVTAALRVRVVGEDGDSVESIQSVRGDTLAVRFYPKRGAVRVDVFNRSKTICSANFQAIWISSSIYARLGTLRDTVVPRSHFLAQDGLHVVSNETLFDVGSYSRIHSYAFEANIGGEPYKVNVSGSQLSPEVVRLVRPSRKRMRVVFSEIRSYCADCIGRRLPDLTFIIY